MTEEDHNGNNNNSHNNQAKKFRDDDQETVGGGVMEGLKFLGIRFGEQRQGTDRNGQGGIVKTISTDEAWNKPDNNNNNSKQIDIILTSSVLIITVFSRHFIFLFFWFQF